jgi:hypothetical protein
MQLGFSPISNVAKAFQIMIMQPLDKSNGNVASKQTVCSFESISFGFSQRLLN